MIFFGTCARGRALPALSCLAVSCAAGQSPLLADAIDSGGDVTVADPGGVTSSAQDATTETASQVKCDSKLCAFACYVSGRCCGINGKCKLWPSANACTFAHSCSLSGRCTAKLLADGELGCDATSQEHCENSLACMYGGACTLVHNSELDKFPQFRPFGSYMTYFYWSESGKVIDPIFLGNECRPSKVEDCQMPPGMHLKRAWWTCSANPSWANRGCVLRHNSCCAVYGEDHKTPMPDDKCW